MEHSLILVLKGLNNLIGYCWLSSSRRATDVKETWSFAVRRNEVVDWNDLLISALNFSLDLLFGIQILDDWVKYLLWKLTQIALLFFFLSQFVVQINSSLEF